MRSGHRHSVLVVDDDPTFANGLAELMRAEGYEPRTAADGVEALDALRTHRPCLVVIDLNMPRLNGTGLHSRMVSDARLRSIPVVVMTGDDRPASELPSLIGAPILRKPRDLGRLTSMVATCCDLDARRAS
ncbi:MAG: response regulator [bacterium]|nr:response regulator [bacterium]